MSWKTLKEVIDECDNVFPFEMIHRPTYESGNKMPADMFIITSVEAGNAVSKNGAKWPLTDTNKYYRFKENFDVDKGIEKLKDELTTNSFDELWK